MPKGPFLWFVAVLSSAMPSVAANGENLFHQLDEPALRLARQTVQDALEHKQKGAPTYWSVPGVARGAVIPLRTWRSKSGHWCRSFEENLQLADGRRHTGKSIRCRSDDGRWKITGDQ